ncbi:MAG: hypothetical protein R3Y50_00550 [Rikenellaceae bacterium]
MNLLKDVVVLECSDDLISATIGLKFAQLEARVVRIICDEKGDKKGDKLAQNHILVNFTEISRFFTTQKIEVKRS